MPGTPNVGLPPQNSDPSNVPASSAISSTLPERKFRCVFLGDISVGKTSIINRYTADSFDRQYQATIGIDFLTTLLQLEDRTVRLLLWDSAGQERFRSIVPSYIRNTDAAIVVYDVCSRESFNNTSRWVDEVRNVRGPDAFIALVGNKVDNTEKREVSTEEGEMKARELGALFHEVSAKSGANVKLLFRRVVVSCPATVAVAPTDTSAAPVRHKDPFLVTPSRQKKAEEKNDANRGATPTNKSCSC